MTPWLEGKLEQREPEPWGRGCPAEAEIGREEGEEISTEKYKVCETNLR